jgi:SAM-dependent methyltransferase
MTQTVAADPSHSPITVFDSCPLCGSTDYQPLVTHKVCGNIVRCGHCQLEYTRSRWTAPMADLRRQQRHPLPKVILEKQESQTEDFLDILDRIKRYQPNGKLLELGCLTGHFLALARKAGYDASGIEPDPWAAEYARREFGVIVHETLIPELHFDDQTFDVIAMFHTMEHFTRPMETLLDLHRILKDAGLLAIEIPIMDTLFPKIMGWRHRHYAFDHTLFMSRAKAGEFLRKASFNVAHTELTGRRIRLERLAWSQRKTLESFGRFLDGVFKALNIQDRIVHVNLRDNYRIYCRKAS